MAQAFKCDRCGRFYSKEHEDHIYEDLGISLVVHDTHIDICLKCADSFQNWLEREDKKNDNATDV